LKEKKRIRANIYYKKKLENVINTEYVDTSIQEYIFFSMMFISRDGWSINY